MRTATQKFCRKTEARTFPSGSRAGVRPWLHPAPECPRARCWEVRCAAHETEKQCVRQERTPREGAKQRIWSAWRFGEVGKEGVFAFCSPTWHSGIAEPICQMVRIKSAWQKLWKLLNRARQER